MAGSNALKMPDPLDMSGNLAENWRQWKRKFEIYMTARKSDAEEDATKIAILLHCVGSDAIDRYDQFVWDAEKEDKNKYKDTITKFDSEFGGKKRLVFNRYKFWTAERDENEEFLDYLTHLQKLAKQCEFKETDDMIRDKIVFSTKDENLKEKLLETDILTLEKCRDKCLAAEVTKKEMRQMDDAGAKSVDALRRHGYRSNRTRPRSSKPSSKFVNHRRQDDRQPDTPCKYCGTQHEPQNCPAFGKRCRRCNKRNHFQKMCMTRPRRHRNAAEVYESSSDTGEYSYSSDDDDESFLGSVKVTSVNKQPGVSWYEEVKVGGRMIRFKVDTGAQTNLIPKHVYDKLSEKGRMRHSRKKLKGVSGETVEFVGKTYLNYNASKFKCRAETFIVKDKINPLLGLDTALQLKIVQKGPGSHAKDSVDTNESYYVNSVSCKGLTLPDIKRKYGSVFDGKLGKYPSQYRIKLSDDATPVIIPTKRIPQSVESPLKEKLDKMTDNDVIEAVTHPTQWVNGLVATHKKSGDIRVCLDPRPLNKYILREHHPIPTFKEVSARLRNPKYFTIIDQSDSFWQIELTEDCRDLTTFSTPWGRYRFKRMPFGISSASEVQQKKSEQLFGDIPNVYIINDDTRIAGDTEQEHDEAMINVLELAVENGVKFNWPKLQFKKQQVVYHGNKFTTEGIMPDAKKVDAIKKLPEPQDIQGVQSFLGLVNYLSDFIPNKSALTEPLRAIVKSGEFQWGANEKQAFQSIKDVISKDTILTYFDPGKDITIQCDSSKGGLGAVLLQGNKPIAFTSCALTDVETRYAQIEKEMLAILYSVTHFHHYVYGRRTIVYSDHKPLVAIQHKDFSKISPRLQLMLYKLLRYNIDIKYLEGKKQFIADALSRAYLPHEKDQKDLEDTYILSVMSHYPASNNKKEDYKSATHKDKTLQKVSEYIRHGWPHRRSLSADLIPYYDKRHELYEQDGLIFVNNRLIIPKQERSFTLQRLHKSHQGIEKAKSYARNWIYWPGLGADIEKTVKECKACMKFQQKNIKQPMVTHDIPDEPWIKCAADILQYKGKDYLINC